MLGTYLRDYPLSRLSTQRTQTRETCPLIFFVVFVRAFELQNTTDSDTRCFGLWGHRSTALHMPAGFASSLDGSYLLPLAREDLAEFSLLFRLTELAHVSCPKGPACFLRWGTKDSPTSLLSRPSNNKSVSEFRATGLFSCPATVGTDKSTSTAVAL